MIGEGRYRLNEKAAFTKNPAEKRIAHGKGSARGRRPRAAAKGTSETKARTLIRARLAKSREKQFAETRRDGTRGAGGKKSPENQTNTRQLRFRGNRARLAAGESRRRGVCSKSAPRSFSMKPGRTSTRSGERNLSPRKTRRSARGAAKKNPSGITPFPLRKGKKKRRSKKEQVHA